MSFTAHVVPNGNEGKSEARFLFSNEDIVDDTASINLVFIVSAPSSIAHLNTNNEIVKIASNEIDNFIRVQLLKPVSPYTISLYAANGQLVLRQQHSAQYLEIPVELFPMGVYSLQFSTANQVFMQSVVVSH